MEAHLIDRLISEFVGVDRPYSSCLNAVHKAENHLFPQPGCGDYFETLANVVKDDMPYRATAPQRCEALLRTISKLEAA